MKTMTIIVGALANSAVVVYLATGGLLDTRLGMLGFGVALAINYLWWFVGGRKDGQDEYLSVLETWWDHRIKRGKE